jgi:ribonuclease P protein component
VYRFRTKQRLLKTGEFSSVFNFRRSKSSALFQVFAIPNELGFARLGLVVSKKVAKRAVSRNYIKRLAREGFRLNQHDLPSVDYVVRAKKKLLKGEGVAAQADLLTLMKKIIL